MLYIYTGLGSVVLLDIVRGLCYIISMYIRALHLCSSHICLYMYVCQYCFYKCIIKIMLYKYILKIVYKNIIKVYYYSYNKNIIIKYSNNIFL